jgi:hypothetical protein
MITWLPIKDYPDYEVSDDGQVRSLKFGKIKILSPRCIGAKRAYRYISLYRFGFGYNFYVHVLVLEQFNGTAPFKDMEVNHINCIKHDNRLSNLEWVTSAGNKKHAVENGLYPVRDQCSWAKVTERDVILMRRLRKDGLSQQAIANQFNVSRRHVGRILDGTRWKYYG